MTDDIQFTIRTLKSVEDYYAHEDAQIEIWDIENLTAVVPVPVLVTTQKNGGLVAGAFDDRTGRMIGLVYGFLGMTKSGKLKHCSHIMGVVPDLRRSKVGEAIKRFQRDYVLNQGMDLVTWTFDPLESVNGNLNIAKLRTIARTYYRDVYGEMKDNLNKGIPTDRFEVEWWLNHPRVTQTPPPRPNIGSLLADGALLVNPAQIVQSGLPHPGTICTMEPGQLPDILLVEVPPVYQAIKVHSMDLAREWRYHTRQIFERVFALGYVVTDFLPTHDANFRRNYYILEKEPPIPDV